MNNVNNRTTCTDCHRVAIFDVLVPWIDRDSVKGADWEPVCRAHYPTGERWDTILLRGQRTLDNARWLVDAVGHNGIPTAGIDPEDYADLLEQRDYV